MEKCCIKIHLFPPIRVSPDTVKDTENREFSEILIK